MKKKYHSFSKFLSALVIIGFLLGITTQKMTYAQQPTNGDLEQWGPDPSTYTNETPIGWGTYNVEAFGYPQSTYEETTDVGEGLSSAKLETTTGYGALNIPDTLPGIIVTGAHGFVGPFGEPYTDRPSSLSFKYKPMFQPNDTGLVYLELSRYDAGTGSTIIIAQAYTQLEGNSSSWSTMTIPVNYYECDIPDTLVIQVLSGWGGTNDPVPGSVLLVDSFALDVPTPPSLTVSGTDETCSGTCDGTATANATGGSGSYSYFWEDPSAQTTQTATGLCVGWQVVTIFDGTNCVTDSVELVDPFMVSTSVTDATCGVSDGDACITISGGSGSYNYTWSNNSTTNCTGPVAAGIYNVTIQDGTLGCLIYESVTVSNAGAPSISVVSVTDVTCNGQSDGTATVDITGGATPYAHIWTSGETTQNAVALDAGVHTITVTDNDSCAASASVTISEPTELTVNLDSITHNTTAGLAEGEIATTASGGTGAYTYLWDDSNAQTTATASGLVAGSYTVTVTDDNGCEAILTATVNEPSSNTLVGELAAIERLKIYPNPSHGQFTLEMGGSSAGELQVTVKNVLGQVMYSSLIPEHAPVFQLSLNHVEKGIYFISISSNHAEKTKKIIIH